MSEIQYVWGSPDVPTAQCAISSIAQAMYEKGVMAIGRWITGDGRDPKMGVLSPVFFDEEEGGKRVDCLLWTQVSDTSPSTGRTEHHIN